MGTAAQCLEIIVRQFFFCRERGILEIMLFRHGIYTNRVLDIWLMIFYNETNDRYKTDRMRSQEMDMRISFCRKLLAAG